MFLPLPDTVLAQLVTTIPEAGAELPQIHGQEWLAEMISDTIYI